MIFWVLGAMFLITVIGILGYLIKFMNDEDLEKFADEMAKKRENEYRKPKKQEDITDL